MCLTAHTWPYPSPFFSDPTIKTTRNDRQKCGPEVRGPPANICIPALNFGLTHPPPTPSLLLPVTAPPFLLQDLFLERLYQQLDQTGLSENTYVVIVGDHGEVNR